MRRAVLLAWIGVVGCAGVPVEGPRVAAAPEGTISFAYAPEVPGERCEESLSLSTRGVRIEDEMASAWAEKKELRSVYEVLEASGGVSTKELVRYEKYALDPSDPERPTPVLGRSYVVELVGSSKAVREASGAALTEREQRYFATYWSLGKKDAFGEALDGRSYAPGASMPELAPVMREHIARGWDLAIRSSRFVLVGREGNGARVDYAIELEGKTDQGWPAKITAQGRLVVEVPRGFEALDEETRVVEITAPSGVKLVEHGKLRLARDRTRPAAVAR